LRDGRSSSKIMSGNEDEERETLVEQPANERARPLPGWSGLRVSTAQLLGGDDASPIGVSAVYYPAVGLLLGAAMLGIDRALSTVTGPLEASLGVVCFHALATRGRPLRGLAETFCRLAAPRRSVPGLAAGAAALAILLGSGWLLARVDGGRAALLLFAPMLARCSMVVVATGSREARADGRQTKFSRQLTFREFGLASTLSFAIVFLATNFLGLVLVLLTGLATIAMRLLLHWRLGGVDRASLHATGEIVQLALFALLAAL
jgi:adenosylcobinamide-GDP ribazoletransferase